MLNILVTVPVYPEHILKLRAAAPDGDFRFVSARCATVRDAAWADVIFGNIAPSLVAEAKKLRLLQLYSAGTDGYMNVLAQGAAIANTSGAFGLAISEHMLAMLLMLIKRLHQYRDNQHNREWRDMGSVTSVEGATAVILGLGDIGGEFARRLKALGAYTIGVRRTDGVKPPYVDELVLTGALESVLPRAQILAMALPGTPDTARILDAGRIALMPDGAVVLNVGRGTAIDQQALADAIQTRGFRAGLDVTYPEPLPADSPLWGLENCVITPHVSGYFHLRATLDNMVKIACENIARLGSGKPLINLVDSGTGYRRNKYDGGSEVLR